ncbi:hypothetical protein [Halorubrum sp. Atlit-28R]|uniref:hypothetical protein n=1 Tax=Halorubrum sp. Atlit-28R TaxID=2282129 RepID=UPI0011C41F23|nr:hypothetical protein [Halorubrum sp. Atlit-28R]
MATLTSVGLAGCTASGDAQPPSEDELPDQCPMSQTLDVQWPQNLNTEAVADFAKTYEVAYRSRNSDLQPPWSSSSYSARVEQEPKRTADGYQVTLVVSASIIQAAGSLNAYEVDSDGIRKSTTRLESSDLPDDPTYIPIGEVEDRLLHRLLESAAVNRVETDSVDDSKIEQYSELIATLSPDASIIESPSGGPEYAYFDVEGTPILLEFRIATSDGDLWGGRNSVLCHRIRSSANRLSRFVPEKRKTHRMSVPRVNVDEL